VGSVNRKEPLAKRIARRVSKNIAQFFKHFALGFIGALSDADAYAPSYENCWCTESFCTCEKRGMVPKELLTTTACICSGDHCMCPEH